MTCCVPGCTKLSQNVHVLGGGVARKADAKWIANICGHHHTASNNSMHRLGSADAFNEAHDVDVYQVAMAIEERLPTCG